MQISIDFKYELARRELQLFQKKSNIAMASLNLKRNKNFSNGKSLVNLFLLSYQLNPCFKPKEQS